MLEYKHIRLLVIAVLLFATPIFHVKAADVSGSFVVQQMQGKLAQPFSIPKESIFKFNGNQLQTCEYKTFLGTRWVYPFNISTLEGPQYWSKGITYECKNSLLEMNVFVKHGGVAVDKCTLTNKMHPADASTVQVSNTQKALLVDCYRFINAQSVPVGTVEEVKKKFGEKDCANSVTKPTALFNECQKLQTQINILENGAVSCLSPGDTPQVQCEKITNTCGSLLSQTELQEKISSCKKSTVSTGGGVDESCGVTATLKKSPMGESMCVCNDANLQYDLGKKSCVPKSTVVPGVNKSECEAKGGKWESIPASAMPACYMPAPVPPAQQPDISCTATSQCTGGQCVNNKCAPCPTGTQSNGQTCEPVPTKAPAFGTGSCPYAAFPNKHNDGKCHPECEAPTVFRNGTCENPNATQGGATQKACTNQNFPNAYNGGCYSACPAGSEFREGKCYQQNQNDQNAAAQCVQKGGTWAQGQCLPGAPNAQQQAQQKAAAQQQAQQQAAQQQSQQAQQQCLAQGGQWNGYQCTPPAFNPYTSPYFNQQTVNKPTCNFFGASLTEIPLGDSVDISWEVTGASTISLDTSPKSTTKYIKSTAAINPLAQSLGLPATPQSQSMISGATVTPSTKGTLTLRLKVNNLLQNSDPCKPIKLQVVSPENRSAADEYTGYNTNSNSTQTNDSTYGQLEETSSTDSGIGQEIELASDLAQQKRDAAQKIAAKARAQQVEQASEVNDATYANLCAMFGIGCGGPDVTVESVPKYVQSEVMEQQTPTERLTIQVSNDSDVDVPNIGGTSVDAQIEGSQGGSTFIQTNSTNGEPTMMAYDIPRISDTGVAQYVDDTSKYAPDHIGPQSGTTGQLKQSDVTTEDETESSVGVFTRMWRWFINLIGFGPEQV